MCVCARARARVSIILHRRFNTKIGIASSCDYCICAYVHVCVCLRALVQVAAAAERLGGSGRIMAAFNGVQPSVDAVKWMNFDQQHLDTILYFPLCELSYMEEDLSSLDAIPSTSDAGPTKAVSQDHKELTSDQDQANASAASSRPEAGNSPDSEMQSEENSGTVPASKEGPDADNVSAHHIPRGWPTTLELEASWRFLLLAERAANPEICLSSHYTSVALPMFF